MTFTSFVCPSAPAAGPSRRLARVLAIGSLGIAAILTPACHSPTLGGFLDRAQEASCARLVECLAVPDVATCQARGLGRLGAGGHGLPECLDGEIDQGTVVYDPAYAEACIAALRVGRCTPGATYPDGGDACRAALAGAVDAGGACTWPEECVSGTRCAFVAGPGAGKCTPLPDLGKACGDACADGARCVHGKCVAPAQKGEPCTPGSCADGLWCASSRCAPLPTLGEACDAAAPDGPCRDGGCDPVTHVCAPLPHLGDECTADGRCGGDAFCNGFGKCDSFPAEGELCLTSAQIQCALGLTCVDAICTRPTDLECRVPS